MNDFGINYYYFVLPDFWKNIYICSKKIIIIIKYKNFDCWVWIIDLKLLRLKHFRHTKLSYKHNKNGFTNFYNQHFPKISE
jgi:hypothetical protein